MNPTVSLVIIAKNEAENIQNCIKSVENIVDEIILLDNNSTDDTQEISIKLGAKVYKSNKKNSFCYLRNKAIEFATKDYILILDADEILDKKDCTRVKKIIKENQKIGGFYVDKYNYVGNGHFFISRLIRIIKNDSNFRFYGNIFEDIKDSIEKNGYSLKNLNLKIHHFGFLTSYSNVIKPKYIYYENILFKQIKSKKFKYKLINDWVYLIVCKIILNKYKQALNICNEVVNNYKNMSAPRFLKANILLELGKFDDAKKEYLIALELCDNIITKIDLINRLGIVFFKLNKLIKAISCFESCLKINKKYYPSIKNLYVLYNQIGQKRFKQKYKYIIDTEIPMFNNSKVLKSTSSIFPYKALIDTV